MGKVSNIIFFCSQWPSSYKFWIFYES